MEIKKQHTISIFKLFINHIIGLSFSIISLILILVIGVSLSFQNGIILPANNAEVALNHLEQTYREEFDKSLLPPYCSYIIINETYGVVEKNMSQDDIEKTQEYLLTGSRDNHEFYKIIHQENSNIIVIKYDLLVHFTNPLLDKWIPYPELTIILLLFGLIVLFAIMTASNFSNKLKQNLTPIITSSQKIEKQDLDFEIEYTKISEINSALVAIDSLKEALSVSLKEQWNKEQERKSQLSALAHDIKTPLTVIKGNAELLAEENSKENKELISYIQSSTVSIETYLELLMNVVKDEALHINKEFVKLSELFSEIENIILPMCNVKNIHLNLHNDAKHNSLCIDKELVTRAIINVVDNAIRYSNKDGSIDFIVKENETHILFEIKDCGKGFSAEALKKATQEFFTEDASRTNKHYGLGLNFTKKVVQLHGGELVIENRGKRQGAKVSISLAK